MCLFGLLSIAGPQSADSISKNSQLSRFEEYMKGIGTKKLTFDQEKDLSSIVDFLEENYGVNVLTPYTEDKLTALLKKDKTPNSSQIMEALGLEYRSDYENNTNEGDSYNYSQPYNNNETTIIKGYDFSFELSNYNSIDDKETVKIDKELIKEKIDLFLLSLKEDFSIDKPRLAVLGLNPHAGESGLLGQEELEIIQPAVDEFRTKGNLVFGPYPADGFFGKAQFKDFDGVLGMYHDQGLIPFKYIAFDSGVNFTAGLPVIRTSPDHGTAYDIAGQNVADPGSFLQAMFLALDLVKNRMNA